MSILSWVVLGAVAGFVAGKLTDNDRSGCLYNIVVGVVGAMIGGFVMQFITGESFNFDFSLSSFAVATVGSIILLLLTGAARKRGKKR